jgi:hypothetical protein
MGAVGRLQLRLMAMNTHDGVNEINNVGKFDEIFGLGCNLLEVQLRS